MAPDEAYDIVIETGTQIESGGILPEGTLVWWTYTVTNVGNASSRNVTVTDSVLGEICLFSEVANGVTVGCAASGTVEPQETGDVIVTPVKPPAKT
jgi:hypothetical protein